MARTLWIRTDGAWVEMATKDYVDTAVGGVSGSLVPLKYARYVPPSGGLVLTYPYFQLTNLTTSPDSHGWYPTNDGTLRVPPGAYYVSLQADIKGWKYASGDTLTLDGSTKPVLLKLIIQDASSGVIVTNDMTAAGGIFSLFHSYIVGVTGGTTTYHANYISPLAIAAERLDTGAWGNTVELHSADIRVWQLSDQEPDT